MSVNAAIRTSRGDSGVQALWIAAVGVVVAFVIALRLAGWISTDTGPESWLTSATSRMTAYIPVWLFEALFAGLLWRNLWLGGIEPIGDKAQAGSAFVLLMWLILHMLVVFAGGGILAHMDRPWTQVSSEMISPAHLVTFTAVMPSYVIVGGAAYLYAKKRLPEFARSHRGLMLIVFVAPFMFVPAFDPQLLLQTLDLGNVSFLAAYWIVSMAWSVCTLRLLAQVACLAMKKLPR